MAPDFLVNMTFDDHINHDSVLHEYEYELDSDLDDESGDDAERQSDAVPSDLESRPLPSSKPPTPSKPHLPSGSRSVDKDTKGRGKEVVVAVRRTIYQRNHPRTRSVTVG